MVRIKDNEPLTDGEVGGKSIKQNAGFKYEEDLIKFLRSKGFTCGDPAGPDNSKADLEITLPKNCLLYTSPSPRDGLLSRMPSSA